MRANQMQIMFQIKFFRGFVAIFVLWTAAVSSVFGADLKILRDHVPWVVGRLSAIGDLPATNELRLAIGLPLRDPAGLSNFLAEVYDPTNPNFRKFLTPEEFTARFGPTEKDYESVKAFARANGFKITGTHGNRLLLDVQAPVSDIQRAMHIRLRKFKHPNEARDFFAPDTEPTVDVSLPVADVSGLNNYQLPKPKLVRRKLIQADAVARSGSAAGGAYLGNDFRAAYVPGTTLTGAGQMVGLLQFDGFYAGDVAAYAIQAGGGRNNIPIQTVLLDGFSGTPDVNNGEVALDIQMAMAMAPGLAKIIVYSGGPNGFQNDVLNAMAANSAVKNLSCSWGWGGGPDATTDAIFQQMAAQGQSFFNASGDSDAFTSGAASVNGVDNPSNQNAPSSSPYITQVGGTTLSTTGPGGAWLSETVWNWGGGSGSSGGISSYYSIPSWQANVSMASNGGSTTKRNIPDVAFTADNVYSISDNGKTKAAVGGTSCAAPLWAGFMALVNQQATTLGKPAVGFVNPAIYAVGTSSGYPQYFHDTTTGGNTWSSSLSAFLAVSGFDLCTGWGTPAGKNLINALTGQGDFLEIASDSGFAAIGAVGGPFTPPAPVLTLTNAGTNNLSWSLASSNPVTWLNASPVSGTLPSHGATSVMLSYTAATTNLALGNYTASFKFTNVTSGTVQAIPFQLNLVTTLSVQPTNLLVISGPVGGPFFPSSQDFSIVNLGGTSAVWKVSESSVWLAVNQTTGLVAAVSSTNFTVTITTNANKLKAGIYKTTVSVFNQQKKLVQKLPFTLSIGQSLVVNGGFETGNFNGWTLNASTTQVVNNKAYVHSGGHGAQLGQSSTLGYLSQTLPTTAGQSYLLSLWIEVPNNAFAATPNEVRVQWEGTTIYDQVNLPFMAWTNLQLIVTASMSGSELKIGFRDDPYYLGLDDISLKPAAAPHIRAVVQNPGAFHFTFDAVPDSVYQAQYKTNLAQPDWINLGDPVTANSGTLILTDTNTADFPQKFYRLMLVP